MASKGELAPIGESKPLTRPEIARILGVHPQTVMNLIAEGMPVLDRGGKGKGAQFDAVACLEWQRKRKTPGTNEQERTRYFKASADKIEQEIKRRAGDTIEASEVEARWAQIGSALRERFLSLPTLQLQRGLIAPDAEGPTIELVDDILTELAQRGNDPA